MPKAKVCKCSYCHLLMVLAKEPVTSAMNECQGRVFCCRKHYNADKKQFMAQINSALMNSQYKRDIKAQKKGAKL